MNLLTEIEIAARQHLGERTHHETHLPRLPRVRRRTRMASTLRRVADRLDG
ncbi:MAG: hypothetical protein ABIQ15_00990 [Nocardioides sp.]